MFDRKTIDYGRIDWNSSGVYVYSDYCNRRGLMLPCGRVLDARWVGQTIHVQMSNGNTYVFTGFNSYNSYYPTR
jgi:hypothetical protein